MKIKLLATAAAASALAAIAPAHAALYDFTLAGTNVTGSGVFTTDDTANADGAYAITMTTGSVTFTNNNNTLGISGPTNYFGADNLLYPQGPYLDLSGTSFSLSNGQKVNIYYLSGYMYVRNGNFNDLTSFTVTPEAGAVPEPATWAMMIAGFGLVGTGMRRRDRMIQAI